MTAGKVGVANDHVLAAALDGEAIVTVVDEAVRHHDVLAAQRLLRKNKSEQAEEIRVRVQILTRPNGSQDDDAGQP